MTIIAAWGLFVLGVLHLLMGLARYRAPLSDAWAEGFFGKFQRIDQRRLAFWFTIVGPILMLVGHVAVYAVHEGNLGLIRIIGFYLLPVAVIGVCAFPKSPFWAPIILAPILIAGGCGLVN